MITILNRPYDGLTTKINPVYNGLGFVVSSDKKLLPNFKYIGEIYVNGGKIGELRHNPDISANNYGQFDFGRVIENYLSYDANPAISYVATGNMPKSLTSYYIRFGEEYSRVGSMTNVTSYGAAGSYFGKLRIQSQYAHNLETGDRVLIQSTSNTTYNTWSRVFKINSTAFVAYDITYTSPATVSDAYYIQGEEITNWSSYVGADGANYLAIRVKVNTTFKVGDMISIRQDRKNTSGTTVSVVNSQYENVEWSVVSLSTASTYTLIKTNIPYGAAIASNIYGSVISRNNFVLLNQLSTQNDGSWAWNGVKQWDDFLSWTPSPYVMTNSSAKFLTNNPNKEMDICLNDCFTLSYWGTNIIKTIDPVSVTNYKIRIETYSTPPSPATYAPNSIATDSTISSARLRLQFNGVNLTSSYTAGSLVNFTHAGGTIAGSVLRSYTSSGNTLVITDIPYAGYTGGYNLTITTQIRRYDRTMGLYMTQIGCGGKNLNGITEIANGTCYQYKVFPIKYGANIYLSTQKGEIWTFNLTDCNCKANYRLMWLNDLGGFDYFTFDGRIDRARNITKSNFRRKLRSYKSGNGYTYTYGERGLTTYDVNSTDGYIIRSRFLTQAELDWINYIYESPEVYIIKENGQMVPITITNTDIQLYNKNNVGDIGRLYYYTIEFVNANGRVVQRG